jgi:hypothetical protein
MKRRTKLTLAMMVLALCAAIVMADEKFGVKVYEGAKLDKETSARVSEAFSVEAFCYRTSDGLEKVVAFYKKEPGLEFMGGGSGGGKEGAMFKKGDVDVTIQNPWMDMKTGQLTKDTLISIVKHQ